MEQPLEALGHLPPVRTQRVRTQQSLELTGTPVRAETPFNPWVLGLASVLFDVDKGQTLTDIWPPDVLSEEERAAVAFHAFPDSLSMELCLTRNAVKDSSFSFRIKREQQQQLVGSEGSTPPPPPDFLYGYVFCRQRQDESLRRGGEQASVVVLAVQPLGSVLLPLSQAAGHAYFSEGALALAAVYNHVLMWPPPMPGGRMCLPVGPGGIINARVPHFSTLPPPQPAVDPALQASLTRRASRTISLKAGFSPRLGSSSRRASQELQQQPQQQQQQAGSEAAAAGDAGVSLSADGSQEQQQQQQAERAGSAEGSGGSWSSARPGSRLSRQDLSTAAGSSSSLAAEPASSTQAAAAIGGADSSANAGGCYEWLAATLGQHWRDETPFPEVEPALVLAPLLRDLWTLWQLLVTAQPLMVVGLHPADTSAAVAALASLIAPLPYAADFRPYFTIHDPDFIALAAGRLPKRTRYQEVLPAAASQQQQEQSAGVAAAAAAGDGGDVQAPGQAAAEAGKQQQQEQQPGSAAASKERAARAAAAAAADAALRGDLPVLLGVTNVFFVKALPKWPNVVAVSRKDPTSAAAAAAAAAASSSRSGSPSKVAVSSEGGAAAAAGNEAAGGPAAAAAVSAGGAGSSISSGGSPVPPAASGRFGSGLFSATAAAAVRALQRRHQGPQHLLSHFAPHLWTAAQHVQYIKPDHALLSKARAAIEPAVGASPAAAAAAAAASAGGGSLAAVGAPAATAAARLRRHFAELTAGLLAPFDPYFTPGPDGTVPAWRPDAFLASLDPAALPPALTARLWGNAGTAARALFAGFIESPHFAFWFQQRRAPVLHLVQAPADEEDEDEDGFARVAPGDGDLSDAGVSSQDDDDDGDEVERVQQLLSAEAALSTAWQQAQQGARDEGQQQQELRDLQLCFLSAFSRLPRDLAVQLVTSPARQELLAAAAEAATSSSGSDAAAVAVGEQLQTLLADLLQTAAAQT